MSLEICRIVRDALVTGNLSGAVNLPGVSGAMLARLEPLLELARRLGRFAVALSPERVEGIEVQYGGTDQGAQRVVQLAAVEGALGAMGVGPVTLVNAATLAEGRGIALGGRTGAPEPGFETTVVVTLRAASGEASVVGAMAGNEGHIVRINGFAIDIPPDGHVLVLKNRDVPGVIGRVGTVLGEAQVNIGAYHLSRRTQRGEEALSAVAVDHPPPPEVLERLAGLKDVLEVRLANLNGVA